MSITYKIGESQLVRLNNDRPEAAVNLSAAQLKTVERYIAALDASPYDDFCWLIKNELERMLDQDEPV